MKRVVGFITLAFTFAACEAPTALDESVTQPVSSVANAAAETFTESIIVPVPFGFFVPCAAGGAGEVVEGGGNLQILMHVTMKGDRVTVKQQFNPQGITATGQTTGDTYQVTGVDQVTFVGIFPPAPPGDPQIGPISNTFTSNFRIIGPGPGNNFLGHITFHTTVNANGDVTTEVDNFSVDCK